MYKKLILALILLILPIHALADSVLQSNQEKPSVTNENEQVEMKYTSAAFTKPETENGEPVKQDNTFEGFEKAAENNGYILYVNEESLALKIQDKKTGYVWNSGLDNPDQYRINNTWEQMIQSAITIEYTDRQGKKRSESILTNDSRPKVKLTEKGFNAEVFLNQAKISFQINVELHEDQLLVSIPKEEIKENKRTKLISIRVYPFFGAVHKNEVNGYMFLPDGSGALIRYEQSGKKGGSPFVGSIFGEDQGFKRSRAVAERVNPVQQIKIPVFGAVHGVKQNAFLTVIEDGYAYGNIVAYPAGISTDFNWISSQYHYRYEYYQPTSKNMKGINVYQKNANEVDIKLRYMFLNENEADYVGMAKRYQEYLVENGQLEKQEDKAEVRLEFFGGEVKNRLLWDTVIPMTEVTKIPQFTKELMQQGVNNMHVIYKGWSKGGLTGTLPSKFPIEKKLGNKDDIEETTRLLKKENIPIYFQTDYTKAFEGAKGYSGGKDVAKKVSSETITLKEKNKNIFYLSPFKSLEIAKDDVKEYKEHGISNLAIDTTGFTSFSDFNKSRTSDRTKTIETYGKLFNELNKSLGSIALYEPNVYAWNETDRYLDIPMSSSNYVFETDSVPFLQIVLKGYVPYYAPFSNYNANPTVNVLRMIEYGAYPSFLLTDAPSNLLIGTPSKDVYTSEFSVWKDKIAEQYAKVEQSLGQVEGASIVARAVPKAGIVEVSYSNGKTIVINYTDTPFRKNTIEIAAKDFAVIESGE
ncbi:hypothetical protein AM500_17590 [Bacillus sp. FJAT-18017]|uniref:DUF5696 domain-containing protein n=1 Tax=Bacillus sp. FJAT-18017 TaxID=1705566 RepID=UPI0006AE7865|nr:DUF5696 domain-containing protein [Bacillus sp. FJAT-18017]ALC91408.1 hypothetical protein AM500_17590 [Bacillus sp. FJAT-18017]